MNAHIKNFILLVIVLVLSYFTAQYFGSWYDKFSPQEGSSFLGTGKDLSLFVAGFPFAYVFFVSFIFELFGIRNKKWWMIVLLILAVLLWISVDLYHIYLPIILGGAGFLLAWPINFFVEKLKKQPEISRVN